MLNKTSIEHCACFLKSVLFLSVFGLHLVAKCGDYCKRDSLKCEILFILIKVLHARLRLRIRSHLIKA